jgi:hypothetical protein
VEKEIRIERHGIRKKAGKDSRGGERRKGMEGEGNGGEL